jgi:putative SOS response-associated peptidase YedK
VPGDAFYEWKAMADGKQPYAIARRDGAPLALAGCGGILNRATAQAAHSNGVARGCRLEARRNLSEYLTF